MHHRCREQKSRCTEYRTLLGETIMLSSTMECLMHLRSHCRCSPHMLTADRSMRFASLHLVEALLSTKTNILCRTSGTQMQ